MAEVAPQELGQGVGVERGVVDAVDEGDLVGDPPTGRPGVVAGGGHHLGHRPAPVERHEDVAERVAGGVEADRQGELGAERGEPADARHDPARADA